MSWVKEQGEVEEITVSRAKRIRRLYSPASFEEDNSSLNPSLAAEQTSSKSAECDSFASNSEGAKSDQVSESSAAGLAERKQMDVKGGLKTQNHQQRHNLNVKDWKKTGAYLELEVEKFPQSALVDVDLTVEASKRAEKVPFVCLTSEAYGTAVLGYPLEIGELTDGSETLRLTKESFARKLFCDKGIPFHQLVWKTSKRTPVCYATHSLSSAISKNVKPSEDAQDSIHPAREDGVLIEEKSLLEFLENPKQFNRGFYSSTRSKKT